MQGEYQWPLSSNKNVDVCQECNASGFFSIYFIFFIRFIFYWNSTAVITSIQNMYLMCPWHGKLIMTSWHNPTYFVCTCVCILMCLFVCVCICMWGYTIAKYPLLFFSNRKVWEKNRGGKSNRTQGYDDTVFTFTVGVNFPVDPSELQTNTLRWEWKPYKKKRPWKHLNRADRKSLICFPFPQPYF